MTSLVAALFLAAASVEDANPTRAATPIPIATPSPTATPAAEPLDPRLYDPGTPTTSPEGPLLDPNQKRRRDEVAIRLGPAIGLPMGALAAGGVTWAGLAGRSGDSGLPLLEIAGGAGGGIAGATLGTFAMIGVSGTELEGYRPFLIPAATIPIGAGLGTWAVAQKLEGASRHEEEALAGAIAGAFAGEALFVGTVALTRAVGGGPAMWLAFVPVGAGATLGYRLARGPSGRDEPLWKAPVRLTLIF